jgi:hypothetical protein
LNPAQRRVDAAGNPACVAEVIEQGFFGRHSARHNAKTRDLFRRRELAANRHVVLRASILTASWDGWLARPFKVAVHRAAHYYHRHPMELRQ